jgi:hypothetical protein
MSRLTRTNASAPHSPQVNKSPRETEMVVYEVVGGLVFLALVALGIAWLNQNLRINKGRK